MINVNLDEQAFKTFLRNAIQEVMGKSPLPVIPQIDKPLRMPEAAKYLGCTIQTLYAKISQGKIKPHKPGKHNLFYKADLDAFIRGEQPEQAEGFKFLKRNKKARI